MKLYSSIWPPLTFLRVVVWSLSVAVLLLGGCSPRSRCEDLRSALQRDVVQHHIESWISLNVINKLGSPDLTSFSSGGGLGFYVVNAHFDWSLVAPEIKGGGVKLLGSDTSPKGVVFLVEGPCSVIYSFYKKDIVGINDITPSELEWISDKIAIFRRER